MLRSSVALVGLVFVAGCAPAPVSPGAPAPAPVAYAAPVYVNPMPYSHIDPAPFMNQPRGMTSCQPIFGTIQCQSY